MIGGLQGDLRVDLAEHRVEQRAGSEAHRIVGRELCFLGRGRDSGLRFVLGQVGRVEREARDPRRPLWQGNSFVQLDQLGQARQRRPRIALDLGRLGAMAEDEDVRRRAVDQASPLSPAKIT